ncbi:MAG: methyltransferase domain-containing protein [Chlamydiales bacterium]|nr:methyltransferase domain-containing protein [Chlamydiales bacterium]
MNVETNKSSEELKKKKLKAQFDRLWLRYPKDFDPVKGALGSIRFSRSMELLEKHRPIRGESVLDLACGTGELATFLAKKGALVDACDISTNALNHLKTKENIRCLQDTLPHTNLEEKKYDIILLLDALAYFDEQDMRLVLSEVQRLLKPKGHVLISTPLDLNSDGTLQIFSGLFATEFSLIEKKLSFHYLFVKLRCFFKCAQKLSEAAAVSHIKDQELKKSKLVYRLLLKSIAHKKAAFFLKPLAKLADKAQKFLEGSDSLLLFLEGLYKKCSFNLKPSHAIFLGHKKPLFPENNSKELNKHSSLGEKNSPDLYDSLYS